jgi:hypothetical protein
MGKRILLIGLLLLLGSQTKAQQYGLFNTNTSFDSFENPAQKSFVLDFSRQYSSTFLLPNIGVSAANRGDASYSIKFKLNEGKINTADIPVGNNDRNVAYQTTNAYLFTFRTFLDYRNHRELGFAWQLRSDAYADYSNEAAVAFRQPNRLSTSQSGLFDGKGYEQTYHQISVNYRADYDDQLAFGFKFSLLSGIVFNEGYIDQSSLTVNNNRQTISLKGAYRANFLHEDDLDYNMLAPDFKNPGLSASFGTTYMAPSGVFMMANIKDLGFIHWNKNSTTVLVDDVITLNQTSANASKTFQRQLVSLVNRNNTYGDFYSPTNAKIDFLIAKNFGWYSPSFIVSKNVLYHGGDVVWVNNFRVNELSFSLSPAYNLNQFLLLGAQAMYQTPNFEFFVGTDNLLKSPSIFKTSSYEQTKSIGASLYIGFSFKFGYVVEHPQNSSYMPGLGN